MSWVLSFMLAIFSTIVMSYISMATPIGPWIAPTLVLCTLLFFGLFCSHGQYQLALVYVTISGSIGGILGTAFGFSFPTLYFMDAVLFDSWMAQPLYFIVFVSVFASIAAFCGMWIANVTELYFLDKECLAFPVAQMIYKMIDSYDHIVKAWELITGFVCATVFCILQDGVRWFSGIIPKTFALYHTFSFCCVRIPVVEFELWPMLWAIGFVTSHVIVLPLSVGAMVKFLFVPSVHELFFNTMLQVEFLLAFCGGIILAGALQLFSPYALMAGCRSTAKMITLKGFDKQLFSLNRATWLEGFLLLIICSSFFFYIKCGILLQVYILLSTLICTYQIIFIAGETGLAQLGRFATFVLIPGLCLFNLDTVQIMVISTFVEAVAGVAVDILCGRKIVRLAHGSLSVARRYQYFGIIISSAVIGVTFWLLINRFTLGSPELFAQRSQMRQLLIAAKQFNYWVLLIGMLFGLVLRKIKINPMLVLGGLLMPINISLGFVFGGLGAMLVRDKQELYPFWSGVFAADSVWMLFKALG